MGDPEEERRAGLEYEQGRGGKRMLKVSVLRSPSHAGASTVWLSVHAGEVVGTNGRAHWTPETSTQLNERQPDSVTKTTRIQGINSMTLI